MNRTHVDSSGTLQSVTAIRIGDVIGLWTVIGEAERKHRARHLLCRCACGTERIVAADNLLRGRHRSCGGCQGVERHGMSNTPEYGVWKGMIKRCTNVASDDFRHYGARGISVCPQWLQSFTAFLADVGPRPTPEYSIDRYPDNDGNYEPGNVRWSTQDEQMSNMRRNRVIEFNGLSMTLSQWSRHTGLSLQTLSSRLRLGWSVERLFSPGDGRRSA